MSNQDHSYTISLFRSVILKISSLFAIIITCINGPSSNKEQQKTFKTRQYNAIVQQLPFSSSGNILTSSFIIGVFWQDISHHTFILWAVCLWGIGFYNIFTWWRHNNRYNQKPPHKYAPALLILNLSCAAILHVAMATHLFGETNEQGRLLLMSILIAFTSIGSWMFSFLPIAGLLWVFIFTGGITLGLPNYFWGGGEYLIILGLIFVTTLASTVLVSSRMFLKSLESEAEVDSQHQVVGMLLNDFEKSSRDWLWETNKNGQLQHTSLHIADVLKTTKEQLEGQDFSVLLSTLCISKESKNHFQQLNKKLNALEPFKHLQIPVQLGHETKWWALSAKPLLNSENQFLGWRGVVSDITQAKLREQNMEQLANFDTLTGLANRHQFNERLNAVFLDGTKACGLLLLDLDNFKMVNDSLGHVSGDKLLQTLARRLQSLNNKSLLLARLGGDEFAILLIDNFSESEIKHMCELILTLLKEPIYIEEHRIEMLASMGVAIAPDHASTAKDLFKFADMALYYAKESGKGYIRFFEQHMQESNRTKLALLNDMKNALFNNEFTMHYQPQINFKTEKLEGFEALVRWEHPTKGTISPQDFIPLAEESGLIAQLGEFILDQSCKDAANWPEHLTVSVNISSLQFSQSNIIECVKNTLLRHKLAAKRLELELTESVMIDNYEKITDTLSQLRALGVRIALDDFGTGYSSLSYLQEIPLDKLKIDRSFVMKLDEPDNTQAIAIIKSIISLAHALNFETTVEGIEYATHIEVFKAMDSTYGQGYYYAKPADANDTLAFISSWTPPL
ncbi:EAL domain-containing protein [Pseudoalteromonas sp. MMG010]|uniref:sensor domain-containing protein n=1 Tax=Pseudoalteromonas sp. MMG010 TaxID=2822685 RepID=UPI001B3A6407|nr:EAL domain-containing protein [Pseudoalteromonas sp. MMG010]MBQ4832582.1 EAL domain-containing protein [Pseudoalteromonas sp. MMG010]